MHFWDNEIQPDLFKNIEPRQKKNFRRFFVNKKMELTVSYDSVVVVIITLIMMNIVVYTLGVEKGKNQAKTVKSRLTPAAKQEPALATSPAALPQQPALPRALNSAQTAKSLPQPPGRITPAAVKKEIPAEPAVYYTIQLASYSSDQPAKAEEARWNKKGFKTLVAKKGQYYVLYVGNFTDKNTADKTLQDLKKNIKDCVLRTISSKPV